jgi:biopolymer transport protein ExbD
VRIHRRKTASSYDLNLAPFLDIIVAIIPMLLLSIAFVQVKMIETNIPQVVAQKIQDQKEQNTPKVNLALKVSKAGFGLVVTDNGKTNEHKVALNKEGKLDFAGLLTTAIQIKKQHQDIFNIDLLPEGEVTYVDLVHTMDTIRRLPASAGKVTIKDEKTGEEAQTDFMFPDVTFANVVE